MDSTIIFKYIKQYQSCVVAWHSTAFPEWPVFIIIIVSISQRSFPISKCGKALMNLKYSLILICNIMHSWFEEPFKGGVV